MLHGVALHPISPQRGERSVEQVVVGHALHTANRYGACAAATMPARTMDGKAKKREAFSHGNGITAHRACPT